mgnify:CR=1 FL=1
MSRRGVADLPLHGGHCPPWLFERMHRLAGAIVEAIVLDYGPEEVLRRVSDPFWFQAFGCVLGFDWHSSGLTTTVCGALKVALAERGPELGLFVAGGKGATSRRTPREIEEAAERYGLPLEAASLTYASRMAAKVDSAAVQDGFTLYHHAFFFTARGRWAVVQQGMQEHGRWARRYHWLDSALDDFVEEPHAAVCSDRRGATLNLVDRASRGARAAIAELAAERPDRVLQDYRRVLEWLDSTPGRQALAAATRSADPARSAESGDAASRPVAVAVGIPRRKNRAGEPSGSEGAGPGREAGVAVAGHSPPGRGDGPVAASGLVPPPPATHPAPTPVQLGLFDPPGDAPRAPGGMPALGRYLSLPAAHAVPDAGRLEKVLRGLYERGVKDFEELLGMPGVGAQTVRALAMVAEVVHGVPASFRDPARYSFAHGGKDGHPYPVRRDLYDRSVAVLQQAVERARLGDRDKLDALRRLSRVAAPAG